MRAILRWMHLQTSLSGATHRAHHSIALSAVPLDASARSAAEAGQQIDGRTTTLPTSRGVQEVIGFLCSAAIIRTRTPRVYHVQFRLPRAGLPVMFLAMLLPATFAPRLRCLHMGKQSRIAKLTRPIEHGYSSMFNFASSQRSSTAF